MEKIIIDVHLRKEKKNYIDLYNARKVTNEQKKRNFLHAVFSCLIVSANANFSY